MYLLVIAALMVIYGIARNDQMFLVLGLAFAVAGHLCPRVDRIVMGGDPHEGKFNLANLKKGQKAIVNGNLYTKDLDGDLIQCTDEHCADGHLVDNYGKRINKPNKGIRYEAARPPADRLNDLKNMQEGDVYVGEWPALYDGLSDRFSSAAKAIANKTSSAANAVANTASDVNAKYKIV